MRAEVTHFYPEDEGYMFLPKLIYQLQVYTELQPKRSIFESRPPRESSNLTKQAQNSNPPTVCFYFTQTIADIIMIERILQMSPKTREYHQVCMH
jgi:hypothetical protein